MDTTRLDARQMRVLRKHMNSKVYDRNGTGDPKTVIARVFIPCGRQGEPQLILVCQYSRADRFGRFDYCVFTDGLHGGKHVPSDSFGHGTRRDAIGSLKEQVFGCITGIWPWVIHQTWQDVTELMRRHGYTRSRTRHSQRESRATSSTSSASKRPRSV